MPGLGSDADGEDVGTEESRLPKPSVRQKLLQKFFFHTNDSSDLFLFPYFRKNHIKKCLRNRKLTLDIKAVPDAGDGLYGVPAGNDFAANV